jgi:GntP family gluconate:H+ symporter
VPDCAAGRRRNDHGKRATTLFEEEPAARISRMIDSHSIFLLVSALAAVVALIALIAVFRVNPFIVIFVTSLGLALAARMPAATIVKSFETGVGNTLGHVAVVVGLGTMLGKMLAESGGAERIAETLIAVFGEKRLPWAMMLAGIVIGLPVFFEVGFVLLMPLAYTVARNTGKSLVLVGLPMFAGLSVVHGLVPPHPAALIAVTAYGADIGRTIGYALLVGVPAAILAGPMYAKLIAPSIQLPEHNPIAEQFLERAPGRKLPSFAVSLSAILLPVALMMIGSWADAFTPRASAANATLRFLGNADIALLAAVIVSFFMLGTLRGFDRETILKFSNECLAPTANITLLVGAGGGFGRILQDSGVSNVFVALALRMNVPVLLLAWIVAALIRVATGSSTVAMTTAAGIVAPIALSLPSPHPELLAVATGAGALIFSHVNDGGFWLVKEYCNMSVAQTLKTWTVCETIISVSGLGLAMALTYVS